MTTSVTLLPHKLALSTAPLQSLPLLMHDWINSVYINKSQFFSFTIATKEISIISLHGTEFKVPGIVTTLEPYLALSIADVDGIENSGKRIHDVSEALAKRGISIFYQSTYQTDFLLMKESSWKIAKFIFNQIGFEIDDPFDAIGYLSLETVPQFDIRNQKAPFHQKVVTGLKLFGLNRDYFDEWILVMIQYVFYKTVDFFSITISDEGISVVASETLLDLIPIHMTYRSLMESKLGVYELDVENLGLDSFGVVYSTCSSLVSRNINLMYLSTFKTSNILVAESDIDEADGAPSL
jgi:hypothetical protein